MRVAIRADASLDIGSGHVMRCLTLADSLVEYGAKVVFLCRPHQGNLISYIQSKAFPVLELSAPDLTADKALGYAGWLGTSQEEDARQCVEKLGKDVLDWLIVDHYALDEIWEAILKSRCSKIMVIDDLGDRRHICDMLLDQNFGSTPEKYQNLVFENCQVLAGSEYGLLRPEFYKWREYSLRRRKNPRLCNILINLGGVDAGNVTTDLIEQFSICELPHDISITVVMGAAAPHLELVQKAVVKSDYQIAVKTNVSNMAELMANADLAIGAAGSTAWERCCLGLPTIQLVIAENQKIIAEALVGIGAIYLLSTVSDLGKALSSIETELKKMSDTSSRVIDGLGAAKVCDFLISSGLDIKGINLIPYTSLSLAQLKTVLDMRNNDDIRKWMHKSEKISWEDHLAFVRSLRGRKDRLFFLAVDGQKVLGAVNFTDIDYEISIAELGIFSNPILKEEGQGTKIIKAALEYAKSRLNIKSVKLEVIEGNHTAIRFYRKFGFRDVETMPKTPGFLKMEKCIAGGN